MSDLNVVMETSESTVMSEYEPCKKHSTEYQTEADLEKEFINMLQEQGYEYLNIHEQSALINNLRMQLEKLNEYKFSDDEWSRFFHNNIANSNDGIIEKTQKIQEDYIQVLKRDDGTTKNIYLIDKIHIHNNSLQVINQYTNNDGNYKNRYDVTILVNGLPLVQVELKRRGVPIKEAFNQINRYQEDSYWAGSGLFEFIQIFVISNGTHTKYYSNSTRNNHIKEMQKRNGAVTKSSSSFKFTTYWADSKNNVIMDLVDFTRTFFAKHTILNILTKYCVFTTDKNLLVMRPYQIVATERILNKIEISTNYKKYGTIEGGGYIWHTTGSGKTLTSFKTALLASKLDYIDKVLFVVDRRDLDYQTMKAYDSYQKGAANGNRNSYILQKQLENDTTKIIVTTIQKLSEFVKRNPTHEVYQKHVVIVFDECHRSQFGEMHAQIVKHFKKYHLFGFTGTPIMAENAPTSRANVNFCTTENAFGQRLHTYTIVDAINDENVLPFKIDYVNTVKTKEIEDAEVEAINKESVLQAPQRITNIVSYILEHFDQKTKRNVGYTNKGKEQFGFNSIFAVQSIPMAQKYYLEFKKQIAEKQRNLNIAIIYSYAANGDEYSADGIIDEEGFETDKLDINSRKFLDNAIDDYNKKFNTNFSTDGESFQNYYKDLSMRTKNKEVDILIVVNMFLTGFDAPTLNTLWVDKNLRKHGLIQAFSRTNRILNSVKNAGNIVCFRNLQKETEDAIALFGDKNASGIVLLKKFEDYYNGYDDDKGRHQLGYKERIEKLLEKYPLGEPITGEKNTKDFIMQMGNILRLRNILSAFDQFEGNEILTPRDFQDYTGIYNDLYESYKSKPTEENIQDDVVFEMELVKSVEVNIDYILMLVEKYHKSNCQDKEIVVSIDKAIRSSLALRSKKELIDNFVAQINVNSDVYGDWTKFVEENKEKDIETLITDENLNPEETRKFINRSFKRGEVETLGTDIEKVLPPMRRFGGNSEHEEKKVRIIDKIKKFFEKYSGITNTQDEENNGDYYNEKNSEEESKVAEENEKYEN